VQSSSILLALHRAVTTTTRLLVAEFEDGLLTAPEAFTLAVLHECGGITVAELRDIIAARPTTMTGILDRLRRLGLIDRFTDPLDRRSVLIDLTTDGTRLAAEVYRMMADLEKRMFGDAPADAIDRLRQRNIARWNTS
jgi:MarR family transcriptional regulator, organic hydroperoxide resistance regulator